MVITNALVIVTELAVLCFYLFQDTFEERNRLMRDVYPNLRTYCQGHGLEFQVVDMRWGVRDEATADHKTSELCMQEIRNCQRLSPGPNFVVSTSGNCLHTCRATNCFKNDKTTAAFFILQNINIMRICLLGIIVL